MIDSHCHLNFHAFDKDYDDVIKDAFDKGLTGIINVGTKLDSSWRAVELSQNYPNLYAIVGVHPHHSDKLEDGWIEKLQKIAKNKKVVAIGEIGLDYFSYKSNDIVLPKLQKEVFIKQIELAYNLSLPLQIHNRQAGEDILKILKKEEGKLLKTPGMFHCFSGTLEFLEKILDLGFYVGFDGNITYKGIAKGETTSLEDLVKKAPLERIVLETDSPYLTPEPYRGSRNTPSHVIIVADFIAKIKGVSREKVVEITTKNTHNIFRL